MQTKENNWHLSRSISIGHIVTTGLVIISAVIYLGDIKENVAINATNISHNTVSIDAAKESNHDMFKRIDTNINSINDKIDNLYKLLLDWNK